MGRRGENPNIDTVCSNSYPLKQISSSNIEVREINVTSAETGNNGSCHGFHSQTSIPETMNYCDMQWCSNQDRTWQFNPCWYTVPMEEDCYNFTGNNLVSVTDAEPKMSSGYLSFEEGLRKSGGTVYIQNCVNFTAPFEVMNCSMKFSKWDKVTDGDGYLSKCLAGYEGDPNSPDGCTDIDECTLRDQYPCYGNCINTEGNYECTCPEGTEGDGKAGTCTKISVKFPYAAFCVAIFLGVILSMGLCFMVYTYRKGRRYQRYYQMMEGHLRVFSKRKVKIATNNFDESRILGTGGHGNVYMGCLEDSKAVAIKISKEVEESQIAEFVNEIVLLSRINHKNIVRLIGCCIEVKVPMLVYEFVPNGTLHDLLHGKGKNRPIYLDSRIQIALDSAEALSYLHYSIDRSIIHGDFKSANILLGDDYRAKVSDFGASNLVPIDDTQVIVEIAQGTRGYIDPEYYATGVLTKKSDVYSFGIVLLELITRKYAIFRNETSEIKHLASCFVSTSRNNRLNELLDRDIITNNEKVLEIIQELAICCVSAKGEDRPTMKQVVEKLQNIASLQSSMMGVPIISEEPESLFSESMYFTASDTTLDSTGHSSVLEIETHVDEVHPAA